MTGTPDPVDQAWRIHGAVTDWTGKVDSKAAFVLTIESAVIAGVATLMSTGHQLEHVHGRWRLVVLIVGLAALAVSVVIAALVVFPNVRRRHVEAETATNWVFFGHLKNWDPVDLAQKLRNDDILPVLSRQLIVMSRIAWRKHARVQLSFLIALGGAALVLTAALIP